MKPFSLVVLLLTLLLCLHPNTTSAEVIKPPDTLVYYNAWPGDFESPLYKNYKMAPKKPINVYQFKNTDSEILRTIQPGEFITLVTADYHTFPSNSPTLVLSEKAGLKPGVIIYLMSYIGGGDCLAWYNNEIIYIPAEGIEGTKFYQEQRLDVPMWARLDGQKPPSTTLWLRVRLDDYQYGWIKYESYRDWQRFGSSIFQRG